MALVAPMVTFVRQGNAVVSMDGVEQAQPIVGRDVKVHSDLAVDKGFIQF
jgi:hypothetical protein